MLTFPPSPSVRIFVARDPISVKRTIYLGPKAQELVREFVRDDLEAPLFRNRVGKAYTVFGLPPGRRFCARACG